jgi:hypothetical protein
MQCDLSLFRYQLEDFLLSQRRGTLSLVTGSLTADPSLPSDAGYQSNK